MANANDHALERDSAVTRLLTIARWRHFNGLLVTFCVVLVAILFLMFISDSLLIALGNLPQYFKGKAAWERQQISWQEYLVVVQMGKTITGFVMLYLGLFVLPLIVALPVAAPLIVLWSNPPAFLFLRPFNRRPLSAALSRAVRKDLGRFGHIYTLADANIFVPWYVRVPLLFGQLSLFAFRLRKIKRGKQLIKIARVIGRTLFRNLNWCLSWKKTFPIASDDACWQQVVEILVRRCHLIFMDLSEFRPNVLWELLLIRRLGLEDRVVYFLRQDATSEDRQSIQQHLGDLGERGKLFYYNNRGAVDREGFQGAVATRLAALPGTQSVNDQQRGVRWASIVGAVLFVIGCLPLLAVFMFPAFQEKLQRMDVPLYFGLFIWALAAWVYLWVIAYWNRLMIFLAVAQTFLVFVFLLSSM